MKTIINRLLAVAVTIGLFLSGLYGIEELTRLKSALARDLGYETYFTSPEDYDVLFLGTSHVMYGISPMDLWEDYGIVSFNWGSPTCSIPSIYWKLRNILDYAKPKLVVVDCLRAIEEDKTYSVERIHEAFDAFDLSPTKYRAVMDLMDDEQKYSKLDKYNVLFRLSAYHSRWDSLSEKDFSHKYVDTKGEEFGRSVAVPIEISHTDKKTEITPEMEGVNYLKKIIELCNEESVPILLTYLPYPIDESWKMEANMIYDLAEEYNVNYINFTDLNVVNYNIDFSDSDSHMNMSGDSKVTNYLGQYILENYDISDRSSDESISQKWNEDYEKYIDYKAYLLNGTNEMDMYLMELSSMPVDITIDLRNKALIQNEVYQQLLYNLVPEADINENTDFIITNNHRNDVITIDDFRENGATRTTDRGTVSLFYDTDGIYHDGEIGYFGLYLDNEECLVGNINDDTSMQIDVYRNDEKIDSVKFVYNIDLETLNVTPAAANR